MVKLGDELRLIRRKLGKSQKEIADSFGIPQTTWSNYEVGKASPPMKILLSLAEQGYPIEGLTTGLMDDVVKDGGISKTELKKRYEFARVMAGQAPPDTPNDDEWAKRVDEGFKKQGAAERPVTGELEKFIQDTLKAISEHEARLSAIEERLKPALAPETEYAIEAGGDTRSFVSEPEPDYCKVSFHDEIAAGAPQFQGDDPGWLVHVPCRFIKTRQEDYYAMRVKGNSMIDALIPDGSMVLLRWADAPQHGKIQAVRIDDGVTLKRMAEGEDHGWTLCHEDGTGRTVPLGEDNHVVGDLVAVLPPNTKPHMRVEE